MMHMHFGRWMVVSLGLGMALVAGGCKPKAGKPCTAGQSFCTADGALFCGDDGKLTTMSCLGPKGCVQHGSTAACDTSLANAGEGCEDNDNAACATDKKSELTCTSHAWTSDAACKGPKGCTVKGNEIFCDHTIGDKGDVCSRDGQIACTTDKTAILKCQNQVMTVVDSCRGAKGCTDEEHPEKQLIEFSCDDSVAQEGDTCASEGNYACAMDRKGMHICQGGKFVSFKACTGPQGCTIDAAAEKLSCDTGSGVFSGAGGVAKVASSSTPKGSGAAAAKAAASAKPAASATATASAKPAASAAGTSSAKPALSSSAKPAASVKIVPKKH